MKKTLIFTFLLGMMGMFQVTAQDESLPGSFDCVEFTTSCGGSALACGFTEAERIQDGVFWDNFFCGNP